MFHRQVTAVALAGALALPLVGCGGSGASNGDPRAALDALRASVPLRIRLKPPPRPVRGPSYALATVRPGRTVTLRDSPEGRVIGRAGAHTEFGSMRVFWIERARRGWLGVAAAPGSNGRGALVRGGGAAPGLSPAHFLVTPD